MMTPRRIESQGRQDGGYKRHSGSKKRGPLTLVVCEGEKTEPLYFQSLRNTCHLPGMKTETTRGRGTAMGMVKHAIKILKGQRRDRSWDEEEDQIWCVFDVESPGGDEDVISAVRLAKQEGVCLALSCPSFEYWYLLHFEDTDRPFVNAGEVIGKLKEYIPNYDKNVQVYKCLAPHEEVAIRHAADLRRRYADEWCELHRPYTGVDQLVILLRYRAGGSPRSL